MTVVGSTLQLFKEHIKLVDTGVGRDGALIDGIHELVDTHFHAGICLRGCDIVLVGTADSGSESHGREHGKAYVVK